MAERRDSSKTKNHGQGYSRWKRDIWITGGAGAAAALMMGVAAFVVGQVSGGEARQLVEAILPTSRFLCSAVMTACATILALMLTLIGMSLNSKADLANVFYRRIKQIAFYNMMTLILATCFLVIHCVPITKSDSIPTWWYSATYYSVLTIAAVLGGAVVALLAMLYAAIRDIILTLGMNEHDELLENP